MTRARRILVVCGLNREAAIVRGKDIEVVAGGGDGRTLCRLLDGLDHAALSGVLSFGLAGALDPSLAVGDVIATGSVAIPERDRRQTRSDISDQIAAALRTGGLTVREGHLLGVDAPVLGQAEKAELRASTGAVGVDMESHVAAAWADRYDLPFVGIRVISDAADRALPAVAATAMRPDGSIDVLRVLAGLVRDPRQLPALVATARDAAAAFRVLGRVRGLLGPGLGFQL